MDIIFDTIINNNITELGKFIQNGIDIDARDEYKRTLLMYASSEKNFEIAKLLIENGAEINLQDRQGWSSLHFAAQSYHKNIIILLLEYGANVNPQDSYGNTPLHRASFNSKDKSDDVIKILLDYSADVKLQNNVTIQPNEKKIKK